MFRMCALWVKRSSRAAVICSSPNTSVHLGNSKFVVMIRLPLSYREEQNWNNNSAPILLKAHSLIHQGSLNARQPLLFKLIKTIFLLCCKQFIYQTSCRIEFDLHTLPTSLVTERSCNMGFPYSGVAYQNDIFSSSDIFSLHEFQYPRFVQRRYGKEVKAFNRFDNRKACLPDPSLDPVILR